MENKQIQIYKDYLNMLFCGNIHSVLCHSKAGLGKTYSTIKVLKEINKPYIYNSGVTTAVALYKMLYENKDKVLVLDDIETIFRDERIINILKAALWEVDGKRMISYKSSSQTLEGYPNTFEFKGKIIILANEVNGKYDESFKALMSRCLKFELKYKFDEIINMSKQIINDDKSLNEQKKTKIIEILECTIFPYHSFNFRLLERLKSFVKYDIDRAEELFLNSIEIDMEVYTLIKILDKNNNITDQIEEYKKQTGKSRMSFYRLKKKLKKDGLIESKIETFI